MIRNPLRRLLLCVLISIAVSLFLFGDTTLTNLLTGFCKVAFMVIGCVFGWPYVLRWGSKFLKIGITASFWILLLSLFKRGSWLWALLAFCLIPAIGLGLGCWVGWFFLLKELFSFLRSPRKWTEQQYLPHNECECFLVLLTNFLLANGQQVSDESVELVQSLTPKQDASTTLCEKALEPQVFYRAMKRFRELGNKQDARCYTFIRILLRSIASSGKLSYAGRELLTLMGECCGITLMHIATSYQHEFNAALPYVYDYPSLAEPSYARSL